MTGREVGVVVAFVALSVVGIGCGPGATTGPVVSFTTSDGFRLAGEVRGSGPRGVILAHGEGEDRRSWDSLPGELTGKGYRVLSFDFRGHGQSTGERRPASAPKDVAAAFALLQSQGAEKVVLVGAGMGGLAMLSFAADPPPGAAVAGIVGVSVPRATGDLNLPGSDLARILAPKFFQAGDADPAAKVEADRLLREAPEPRTVTTYPGTAAGTDLIRFSPAARRDLITFVVAALP